MSSAFRSVILVLAVFATACTSTRAHVEERSRVLRVCADPNNLPFSNKAMAGFENKIADLVADRLNARVEYEWWAQRRGFIRNTLRAGTCDVVIGLPTEMEMAATTRPYYRSSYMFVTRKGSHQPQSFDDPYLKSARVGVHIIGDDSANSPPAHALSRRGVINNVRGYSVYGDYRTPDPPARLITAVANGDIDVAIAWGPLAGFFAERSSLSLQLTPVSPSEDPPYPLVFDMSMGVARSNKQLLEELNGIIARDKKAIDRILHDYSVPLIDHRRMAAR